MLVHFHIGLDKAGSTAIQYHMKLNRQWYAERGIFIPDTGLGFAGHQVLFKEMFPDNMAELVREIEMAGSIGFEQIFISWEGIRGMSPAELKKLKRLFPRASFRIYVYLREQSEVIQSGFLQNVKTGRKAFTLPEAKVSQKFLQQPSRDFNRMLDKFSDLFGRDTLTVKVYDRRILLEGNVVRDLLAAMGLEHDDDFVVGKHTSNVSLDLPSAIIVDEYDRAGEVDPLERKALVDLMLNDIAVNGSHEKYFLAEQEVKSVQAYFLPSNRKTVRRYLPADWPYPDLFSYDKNTHVSADEAEIEATVEAKRQRVRELKPFPFWEGKRREGDQLGKIAREENGWQSASGAGVQSTGPSSKICFRRMWKRIRPFHTGLRLVLEGAYSQGASKSRVFVNGHDAGELSDGKTAIEVPMDHIDEFGCVTLEITHTASGATDAESKQTGGFLLQGAQFNLLMENAEARAEKA